MGMFRDSSQSALPRVQLLVCLANQKAALPYSHPYVHVHFTHMQMLERLKWQRLPAGACGCWLTA
jgi:hypothetical protein